MTLEPIEHEPDDYEPHDAPARPSAARTGGFPRRFWLALTGRPTGAERCRPVTVTGDDGQPVHTQVLGAEPLSDEGHAALGEIVRAAQRKHVADLRAKREAADDDVRAVRALTNAASRMLGTWAEANDDVRRELWTTLHDRADDVHDRYRERYADLDERFGGSEAR